MCCLRYLRHLHKKFNLAPLCLPPLHLLPLKHQIQFCSVNPSLHTPYGAPAPTEFHIRSVLAEKNRTNPIFAIQIRSCGLLKGAASCSSFVFCFNVKVSLFNLSLYLSFSGICYLFSFVIEPAEKLLIISLNGNLLSQVLYVTPFLTIFDLPII